jgi:hypothetical protein
MRIRLVVTAALLLVGANVAQSQQSVERRLYVVPGVHYGTPGRATVALTAFLDGRQGVIGKGNIVILEGGRDVIKAQVGLANVSASPFGYSLHLGAMQTRTRPLDAMPNSRYAGTELHTYLSIVNFGVGFYAPIGDHKGRKGLLSLSIGLGF